MTKTNWLGQYFAFMLACFTACSPTGCAGTKGVERQTPPPRSSNPIADHGRRLAVALDVTCLNIKRGGFYHVGGSGVAVSPRHALTARHVVECDGGTAWKVDAADMFGRQFEMTIDKMSSESEDAGGADVVRLVATGTAEPFEDWALPGALPRLDEVVCAATAIPERDWLCGPVTRLGHLETPQCGFGWGPWRIKLSCGDWKPGSDGPLFTAWGAADYGNSGSGVYNADGRLVGLLVRLSPCSNGQHCRFISDSRVGEYMDGLSSMGWFNPTQPMRTLELQEKP